MGFENISPREEENKKIDKPKETTDDVNVQIGLLRKSLDSAINKLVAIYNFFDSGEKILGQNSKIKLTRRQVLQGVALTTLTAAEMGIKSFSKKDGIKDETEEQGTKELFKQELSPEEEAYLDAVINRENLSGWEIDPVTRELIFNPPSDVAPGYYDELEVNEKEEQEKIEMLKDIFIKQWEENGKININLEVKEQIKSYWKKMHQENGPRRPDLVSALTNLKPWYVEIKEEFDKVSQKTGVVIPEKLIYLSIPESYCRNRAVSSASAVGFFQLMPNTARGDSSTKNGLVVSRNIDERLDVPENARRAAEYLVWLYKQAENENSTPEETWRLVLAGYNGKYFKDFKKEIKNEGWLKKYSLYLTHRENNLNAYLKDIFAQGYFNYKVRRNETLKSIAKKCKVDLQELQRLNNKSTIFLQKGEKIKIPIFQDEIEYKVQQGDALREIAEMHGVTQEDIANIPENVNKIGENFSIREGDVLTIKIPDEGGVRRRRRRSSLETIFKVDLSSALENLNYPEKFFAIYEILEEEGLLIKEEDDDVNWERIPGNGWTLEEISSESKISLKSLSTVNPHIKNTKAIIPKNVNVNVVPKSITDKLLKALKIEKIRATKRKKRKK